MWQNSRSSKTIFAQLVVASVSLSAGLCDFWSYEVPEQQALFKWEKKIFPYVT